MSKIPGFCLLGNALCAAPYAHRTQPATGYQKADDRKQIFRLQIAQLYAPCPMLYAFTNPQPVTSNPLPATRNSQPATRYLTTTIAIPIPPPMHMEMIPVL
jgi:hypothetical protein